MILKIVREPTSLALFTVINYCTLFGFVVISFIQALVFVAGKKNIFFNFQVLSDIFDVYWENEVDVGSNFRGVLQLETNLCFPFIFLKSSGSSMRAQINMLLGTKIVKYRSSAIFEIAHNDVKTMNINKYFENQLLHVFQIANKHEAEYINMNMIRVARRVKHYMYNVHVIQYKHI